MKIASTTLLAAGIMLSASAHAGTPRTPHFDGNWWQQAEEGERTGFLYGLEDCYAIDNAQKMIFEDSWAEYRKRISSYYDTPAKRTTPVAQVFRQLGRKQSSEEHAGMAAEQRYGSEFWRGNNDSARRGFLEAYISCPPHPKRQLSLTKVDFYVQRLDDMYNAGDKHGEDAPSFAGPVADALGLIGK